MYVPALRPDFALILKSLFIASIPIVGCVSPMISNFSLPVTVTLVIFNSAAPILVILIVASGPSVYPNVTFGNVTLSTLKPVFLSNLIYYGWLALVPVLTFSTNVVLSSSSIIWLLSV